VVPVRIGSARRDHGVRRLMKALRHDTPDVGATAARLAIAGAGPLFPPVRVRHAAQTGRLDIGRVRAGSLADGLAKILADTCTLLGKIHGFHWNVTGPTFHSLHAMFQEQDEDLTGAVDELAERIRALGDTAPGSLSQFLKLTTIEVEHGVPDATAMLHQPARDNEFVNRSCRELVQLCHDADDTVTEDLMNGRMGRHEKAAWMLRASLG